MTHPDACNLPLSRVVVFLDILGFRQLIKDMHEKDPTIFNMLQEALSHVEKEVKRAYMNFPGLENHRIHPGLEMTTFSDCIVISAPEGEDFLVMLYAASLANYFLYRGLACRGGIATGSTHHQRGQVFGQGMINAYDLERKVAVYPRIVVSDILVQSMQARDNEVEPKTKTFFRTEKKLMRDFDGCYILNFINPPFAKYIWSPASEGLDSKAIDHYRVIKKMIEKRLLSSAQGDPSVIAKDRWLARYFNKAIPEKYVDSVKLLSRYPGDFLAPCSF